MAEGQPVFDPIPEMRCSGSICENLHCFWKIYNFSSLEKRTGAFYASDPIPSLEETNVIWHLLLFPGGFSDKKENSVQCLVGCSNLLNDSFLGKINVSIRSSKNKAIAKSKEQNWIIFKPGEMFDILRTPRKSLLNRIKNDDVVIIGVRILYTRCMTQNNMGTRIVSDPSQYVCLAEEMSKLPERMDADAVIVVGKGRRRLPEIPVHSAVLSMRSKLFAAVFQQNMVEGSARRIEIVDFEVDMVKAMLEFMYTGVVDCLDVPLALDLLRMADKYAVDGLASHCWSFLVALIDESNVIQILFLTSLLTNSCAGIRAQLIDYICENVSPVNFKNKFFDLQDNADILYDVLVRMRELHPI